MRFPRIFPKAVLVFIFIAVLFIVTAAPVSAFSLNPFSSDFWCGDPVSGYICDKINPLDEIATGIVQGLTGLINGIILFTAGLFLWLANQLIGVALGLNNDLALGKESIVVTGHKIALGVANMGFIVALVVIAFATMFRSDAFGYKKVLPRVIIAALLINFGYFIVTNWLISPVNQVTEAFRSASHFDPTNSFAVFKDAVGIGSVADQNTPEASSFIDTLAKSFTSVLFTAIFSFLGFLTLMAFAVMFFIRYVALSILIILLPIAWITWIFPNLKIPGGHPWTVWWENFTRWLLFAPFAMFFFYLAVGLANKEGFIPPADTNFNEYLGGMVLIVGLLLGGLIAANKMGISGGAMALGVVAKMKGWAQVQAKELGLKYGYGAYKGVRGDEAAKRLQAMGTGKIASKIPGARFATGWIRAAGRGTTRTATGAERTRQEFLKKKFEGLAPFQVADMYEGLNDEEKMAAVQHMVDKGYQWELPKQWTEDLARWQRENLFNKRGRKKLELDAFDKGYSAEVLTAIEDEEAITAIKDMPQRRMEAEKRHFSAKDLKKGLDDKALRARTEAAMEKTIKILGHKGIPGIDPRIISGESYGFRKSDPKTGELTKEVTPTGERYRNLYTDSVLEHMPTAAAALYGRTRGEGASFMVEKTEEWLKRWDKDYLIPKLSEIAALEGKTEDEVREMIRTADQKKKIEWVDATWDDKRKANRAATQLGAYMQTGRRAWFFPTIGGSEAPVPPA